MEVIGPREGSPGLGRLHWQDRFRTFSVSDVPDQTFDSLSWRDPRVRLREVASTGGHPIKEPRVNENIRISPIRLIDADGNQVGVVSLDKAQQMASESGLDMVEVAPQARPPVVRLMDYGRYRYKQQKREKEARKNAQNVDLKEVQIRPQTEDHDFQVKLKRARRFLEEGNVVKVVVRFKGRELRRPEVGVAAMDRMLEAMKDIATVEFRSQTIEGRRLVARMEPGT